MKIFNWNCNGALRKKIENVLESDSDIYIIQESEHPDILQSVVSLSEYNLLWKGANRNKGLTIISKKEISLNAIEFNEMYRGHQLQWFLPVNVEDEFTLIAVWTHKADAEAFGYIGQFYWYLENNLNQMQNIIFIGDFNSNSIWDSWDRWWNHSDVVSILQNRNIYSLYHYTTGETQGLETIPTFYHQKNKEKQYHIDYIFADEKFLQKSKNFRIDQSEKWISLSDHFPLIWEF